MKWVITEPKPGDMIRVESMPGLYHYGIYVSDGEVIQFGLPPREGLPIAYSEVSVISTDITDFYCGNFVEVARYGLREKFKAKSSKEIIAAARARIGERGYDLIHNNCEHFANECVFGEKKSEQIEATRSLCKAFFFSHVFIAEIPESPVVIDYPPERVRDIEDCKNAALKQQKAAAWRLLERALDKTFNIKLRDTDIAKDKNGKWKCSSCWFSISHTDGYVAVAISKLPIGVDIEKPDGKYVKGSAERIVCGGEEPCDSEQSFIELWTKKESAFKRDGGARFDPSAIDTARIKTYTVRVDGLVLSVAVDPCNVKVNKVSDIEKFIVQPVEL